MIELSPCSKVTILSEEAEDHEAKPSLWKNRTLAFHRCNAWCHIGRTRSLHGRPRATVISGYGSYVTGSLQILVCDVPRGHGQIAYR